MEEADIEGAEKALLEGNPRWIGAVDLMIAEWHERIAAGCARAFDSVHALFLKSRREASRACTSRRRRILAIHNPATMAMDVQSTRTRRPVLSDIA